MSLNLNPEKALTFRIAHVANLPWILENGGLYCRNSPKQDPSFVNIGSVDLIDKRSKRIVPVPPGGTLSDYVPFYFTPLSIMTYNIKTGYNGITKRDPQDIVIFVSSIHRWVNQGLRFVFTNQHAYPPDTDFYDAVDGLAQIDWKLLQSRNFRTDDADPGKQLRYQAEALAHKFLPLTALRGVACYNDAVKAKVEAMASEHGHNFDVKAAPNCYFS